MLGTDAASAFRAAGHECIKSDLSDLSDLSDQSDLYCRCDIADPMSVEALFAAGRPDALIHCAAYTAVDRAESEPDAAFRVNALGASILAQACRRTGIPLLAIGTDYVFDGQASAPYHEFDLPNPSGVYARSKFAGEEEVRRHCLEHWIVRTAWLYGLQGKSFAETILRRAKTAPNEPLRVVADQIGSPTFTADLAAFLPKLLELPYGTYHVVNSGAASWYEFASLLVREAGYDETPVQPIVTADWPTAAKRPAYSALRSLRLETLGVAGLRTWQEAAADFVRRSQETRMESKLR
jgi:dTDP-4-dehydrorhamnose reductase